MITKLNKAKSASKSKSPEKKPPAVHPDPDATLQDERMVDKSTGEIIIDPLKDAQQTASDVANAILNSPIFIESVYVDSVKADFVARTVKITLNMELNSDMLLIRERLASLAVGDGTQCRVTIARNQRQLL